MILPVSKKQSKSHIQLISRLVTNSISRSGSSVPLTIWGVAEIHSGIVAASIPALRALVVRTLSRLRTDSKLAPSSYESRNPYRNRARNQYDDDDGTSTFPLQERSDAGNEGGIIKTTEFEVTNTTKQKAEVGLEGSSEGGAPFFNSNSEGNIQSVR